MMDEEKRHREVEKRERLIQAFLIISGFLVAYTGGKLQSLIVLIFSMYLIVTILYYISLTRSIYGRNENNSCASSEKKEQTHNYQLNITDFLAFFTSFYYSLLILTFLGLQLTNGFIICHFWFLLIILTAIFTFSLLSPGTCEWIVNWFEEKKFLKKQVDKYLKTLKVILIIAVIGLVIQSIIIAIMVQNILV
jgi:hypothetical protein